MENLNENIFDYYFKFLNGTNKDKNINKFKYIMSIYDKMVKKEDEIRIIYKIVKTKGIIKYLKNIN